MSVFSGAVLALFRALASYPDAVQVQERYCDRRDKEGANSLYITVFLAREDLPLIGCSASRLLSRLLHMAYAPARFVLVVGLETPPRNQSFPLLRRDDPARTLFTEVLRAALAQVCHFDHPLDALNLDLCLLKIMATRIHALAVLANTRPEALSFHRQLFPPGARFLLSVDAPELPSRAQLRPSALSN